MLIYFTTTIDHIFMIESTLVYIERQKKKILDVKLTRKSCDCELTLLCVETKFVLN